MTTLLGGKYVLDKRLGGGGMAEVFLARTVGKAGFQRPVAIKRILPHYSNEGRFVDMFVIEARHTARLRHPNIVTVLDFDQDSDGSLFLVMELVDGTDLSGLLATGTLPFEVIVYVTIEVLRGLGHAHSLPIGDDGVRGLVHRDVSPQNVLLSWEGECKVSDFGIAKARAATEASASVLVKGKPAYMSPDQANGNALDGTSDMFSVGVMLWEMLSGQPLFASDSLERTLARVMFEPIVRPSVVRRGVPLDLERIALRLLERDRRQRYADADAAIAELMASEHNPRNGREALASLLAQRFPGRAPLRIRDVVRTGPDQATITPSVRATQPDRPALLSPLRRRRRRALAGIAAAVLVAAAGGIVAVSSMRSSPRDAHAVSPEGSGPATPAMPTGSDDVTRVGNGPSVHDATNVLQAQDVVVVPDAAVGPSASSSNDQLGGSERADGSAAATSTKRGTSPVGRRSSGTSANAKNAAPSSGIEEIKLGN